MNAEKSQNRINLRTSQSKQHGGKISFVDRRSTSRLQDNLCKAINESPQATQLTVLQQMADTSLWYKSLNLPIQRFIGAEGTYQEGKNIPFTFDDVFTKKHIAEDAAGAIIKTQARINDPTDQGGEMIKTKHIGNTLATEAAWTNAINKNKEIIPETFFGPSKEDKAKKDFNPGDYDDEGYVQSSSMTINGWDVKLQDATLASEEKNMNRKIGGTYVVTNLDVSLAINHCTQ